VEGLSEETEVQESVESDVFGSIFHRLMEIIYNRYNNQTVTTDILSGIAKDDAYLTGIIEQLSPAIISGMREIRALCRDRTT